MSKSLRLIVDVDDKVVRNLIKQGEFKSREACKKYLSDMLELICHGASVLAPAETGALRESGRWYFEDLNGIMLGFVSFGDLEHKNRAGTPTIEYAKRVHDDLSMTHTNGQAKFLEIAFNNVVDNSQRYKSMLNLITRRLT